MEELCLLSDDFGKHLKTFANIETANENALKRTRMEESEIEYEIHRLDFNVGGLSSYVGEADPQEISADEGGAAERSKSRYSSG